jgi:hypothetical protein
MDVIARDDGRQGFEKIKNIRDLRPDMILLAGGTDGGTITQVVETAELMRSASPRARLGLGYKLPIIYAGNKDARNQIEKLFGEEYSLKVVANIRPVIEVEDSEPARDAIHECGKSLGRIRFVCSARESAQEHSLTLAVLVQHHCGAPSWNEPTTCAPGVVTRSVSS